MKVITMRTTNNSWLYLRMTNDLPGITFNGKKVFKGKAALIREINQSEINLPVKHLAFTGDNFNYITALKLLKELSV